MLRLGRRFKPNLNLAGNALRWRLGGRLTYYPYREISLNVVGFLGSTVARRERRDRLTNGKMFSQKIVRSNNS